MGWTQNLDKERADMLTCSVTCWHDAGNVTFIVECAMQTGFAGKRRKHLVETLTASFGGSRAATGTVAEHASTFHISK